MRFYNEYHINHNYISYRSIPDLVDHMGLYSTANYKNQQKQGKFKHLLQSATFTKPANKFNEFDPKTA